MQKFITGMWLLLVLFATPALSGDPHSKPSAEVDYSHDPATLIVSFREIMPEFADQDQTPLLQIYGDGRVVVFHPAYMKQAGTYEMLLPREELDDLLLQLAPALLEFDPVVVKKQLKASDDRLWANTADWRDITVFHDSDAEISVFKMNIEAYRPDGKQGQTIDRPELDRSWKGLKYDARDYLGNEAVQNLMQAEIALRAMAVHNELQRVE